MNIQITYPNHLMRFQTQQLLQRMLSPLCGIIQEIGLIQRGRHEANVFTSGVDLSGVHMLLDLPPPKKGAYHIGGSGVFYEEMMIRSLAEAIERYAQLMSEKTNLLPSVYCSMNELKAKNDNVIEETKLNFFTREQVKRVNFPFQCFDPSASYAWIKVKSVFDHIERWLPMQLLFVGYKLKAHEPWLNAAVTTGTATHRNHTLATRNALLELIQMDSAVGYWYSGKKAHELTLDDRVHHFKKILASSYSSQRCYPTFYYLPNPDLPGFVIAAIFKKDIAPYYAVGLGADTRLESALYKAFLEGVGVSQLAKILLLEESLKSNTTFEPKNIYDLDNNVAFYASKRDQSRLVSVFNSSSAITTSTLPADSLLPPEEELKVLLHSFKRTGKVLFWLDLTTLEAKELGLVVSRVWSPDTLSLSLPSAPPILHARFHSFGGVMHHDPHPYP